MRKLFFFRTRHAILFSINLNKIYIKYQSYLESTKNYAFEQKACKCHSKQIFHSNSIETFQERNDEREKKREEREKNEKK